MPFLEFGDELVYVECVDADCPAHREGFNHAHAERVERSDSTAAQRPAEGGNPNASDLEAGDGYREEWA